MNNADTRARRPSDLQVVRVFLVVLAALLIGYMFLGRGFAHIGMRPIFVGEVTLVVGLLAAGYAIVRLRLRPTPPKIVWVLLAFMVLGAARTIPYLPVYGVDALRDAVLWGYAVFALIVFVLADRPLVLAAMRGYGWLVPAFALWVPIFWYLYAVVIGPVPLGQGEDVPILFFKNQDMAVHTVGAIAFLVVGASRVTTAGLFLWRTMLAVPLAWAVYITGSISRGASAAVVAGLGLLFLLAPRSRNWVPVLAGSLVLALILAIPGGLTGLLQPGPAPSPAATAAVSIEPSLPPSEGPTSLPSLSPSPEPSAAPTPVPEQAPPVPGDRSISLTQWIENFTSVILKSSDDGLEGTKQFRLAWWRAIFDYTVFGPHFWAGKGFGVNLADDDGFQILADGSLRAPHNSHFTALARMGVPGFVLWILLQGAFGIGLLRSMLAHRRSGDTKVAAVAALILVYWAAMMVNTSFDPYLEGPQGGIWFWTLFGLGVVVMRLTPQPRES